MERLPPIILFVAVALLLTACRPEPVPPTELSTSAAGAAASPEPGASPTAGSRPMPPVSFSPEEEAAFTEQRERLVDSFIIGQGITDPQVIEAMRVVPRHYFVLPEFLDQAYADHPLPIGYGQTISQPYIVAYMTEVLQLGPDDVVLEIGAGSGYQAAVLAEIVEQVYTIEIIGALADQAAQRFVDLGYNNVEVKHADGYFGWEEHAPFDAIIVTAAPDHVPPPLVVQLADGARMVIPVGPVGGYQELWLVTRHGDEVTTESLLGVRFVPLTRETREE